MLAEFCRVIAPDHSYIGVVGRTQSKMRSINDISNIVPIYVDYTDTKELERKLTNFVDQCGKPNLTVAWIHTTAPEAAPLVAKYCMGKFYEITGSTGSQPDHISHEHEATLNSKAF